MATAFPFSAIVGQDEMKLALLIAAVDPKVGGVLAFGDRGSGKSTAVRALAALLPKMKVVAGCRYNCDPERPSEFCEECRTKAAKGAVKSVQVPVPVVDLPLGATEDRVVGALDLERALARGEKTFEPLYSRNADAQSPAGGVSSSANDMARWLLMNLADGRAGDQPVIDPDVLRESHTAQVATGPLPSSDSRSRFYGYGFNVENTSTGHVRLGHSGAFYVGAGTAFGLLPAADVGIVALTNGSPVGAAEAVTTGFTDLVRTGALERDWLGFFGPIFGAIFVNQSKVAAPPPADARPARPLDAYVGRYHSPYAGDIAVTRDGDQLTLTIGPKQLSAPLTHYDGDTFSWLAPGGNGEPVSAVTFSGGGDLAGSVDIELVQRPRFERV